MSEINERVTVDFDEQSYYLDGEYWESWDNYGEEMADAINKLLNDLTNENNELKERNNRQYKRLGDLYRLIEEKDWRALSDIMDDFKKSDELLQKEWSDDE